MEISNTLAFLLLLSLFLFSSCIASVKSSRDDFLECLSHQIKNSSSISQFIYTLENSSYSTILKSYEGNPRISLDVKPFVIFTPFDESQIQIVVHCSKIHALQIRIRSGGHDYEGLSFVSDTPFVIVDLRNLRKISIDTINKTAWIQAGANLGELYHSIATKSRTLSFVAGSCPTVGVGGHFSGGGYSMMSRKYGIAADYIIDAKIIDVKGRILDRNSMGEDLFWAIRGGGGTSFGIIVSWKVKLLDVPDKVTAFNVTLSLEQNATQLIYKWQHIAHKVDNNLLIRIFITTYGKSFFQVSFTAMFVGQIKELLHEMRKIFPELGVSKEDCVEMSWIESILFFAHFPGSESPDVLLNRTANTDPLSYSKSKSDYVQQVISMNGLKSIWKLIQEEETTVQLQFSPWGGKFNDYSESETPFPHRAGNIFMIHYQVIWEELASSQRYIAWTQKLYRYMSRYVSKSPRAAYINYRDLDLGVNNKGITNYAQASIWGMKYFKNNFKRLVQVKTKVDPANFFRNEQSIPPLSREKLSAIIFKPTTNVF
ncbi:berberine bridge enzyme-like 18 [Lycium ferocissimum]|uniref:berberine bridge enzyme-like 18 n=1 Tax=Lycium ferocissimum TaxID=112874 RepID=UPI00281529AF|nr:berberine bridge enzyme-like 18 [Lycium ferocissimum]